MSRFGRSEKEMKALIEMQNADEMKWRQGHMVCRNGHIADVTWAHPGEPCDYCGEFLMPFSTTSLHMPWDGKYADEYRTDKLR